MTDRQKETSIEYIISRGLVKPKTGREQARDMISTLGWRFIFWDTAYSLTFAAITIAVALVILSAAPEDFRFTATVAAAPLLYLLIAVFAETTERAGGLFELKQTCRFTTRQITALRTSAYSAAGAVYTIVFSAVSANNSHELAVMLPLGLLTLFVCALPQLTLIRFARCKWANPLFGLAWVFVNLALPIRLGHTWETFLAGIPVAATFGTAAVCGFALIWQINKMLREVKPYAIA